MNILYNSYIVILGKAGNYSQTNNVVVSVLAFILVQELSNIRPLKIGHSRSNSGQHYLYKTYGLSFINREVHWRYRQGRVTITPEVSSNIYFGIRNRARGISYSRVQITGKDSYNKESK
jgi:hypothetical protein